MECYSCTKLIDNLTYVTAVNNGKQVFYHTHCYYPNLLRNFKRVTKSYIYSSLDDLTDSNSNFEFISKFSHRLDFLLQDIEYEEDDEDLQNVDEDEFEEDFPAAA